jgi:hypothetical protein
VHRRRSVGANDGEKVEPLETDKGVLVLPAVAGEEYGSGARAVADAKDVTLSKGRAVGGRGEGVVVGFEAVGMIGNGVFRPA